jgi:hypothetical protein
MTKWNEILETAIIGKILTTLVEEGYRVEVSDQDGGGFFMYAATGGNGRPAKGYQYWVRLSPGNGADVITDYTTNLESLLAPINKFAEGFAE